VSTENAPHKARPKLRPIEVIPTIQGGRRMITLHDPTGLARGVASLSPVAFFIVSHFDGRHDLAEIQADFARQFGQALPLDRIHEMIEQLEEAGYLDGPRFERHYAQLAEGYRSTATHRARLPLEPQQLEAGLAAIVAAAERAAKGGSVAGIVAPHLDYERGRRCYAAAYGALRQRSAARRFVILGTNHFGRARGVVATDKPFETPLGVTPIDPQLMAALRTRCGDALFEHQFDHQHEHSVELQIVLLQKLFGADRIHVVPLLCPDVCEAEDESGSPRPSLTEVAEALRDAVAQSSDPVCIVAGADFSHVGRRFGDDRDLDRDFLQEVEQHDRQLLHRIEQNDPEGMLQLLRQARNPTKVCSGGCLYIVLAALPDAKVELLHYHQAANPEIETAVTSAALALTY
jgi:AmmeMemoRadiSam system protein B